MSLVVIITLIGVIAVIAQLLLAQINYWEDHQTSSYVWTKNQPPSGNKVDSKFGLTDLIFSPNKVWGLGLLTLILYGLLGFGLASVRSNLWVWALAVVINYWNLAVLRQKGLARSHKNILVKTLLAAQIMPIAVAIAGIAWASVENLPIYLPVALGLAIGINSVVIVAVFTKSFSRSKAVTLATGLSYSGFALGWVVQSLSV